jgi:Transcription elongation factor, GreA/GreB, C-term
MLEPIVIKDDVPICEDSLVKSSVGEDEADPKAGSISFASPVARLLMGKAVGNVPGTSGQELEIIAISCTPASDAADVWDGRFAPKAVIRSVWPLAPRHQHGGTVITKVPSDAGS